MKVYVAFRFIILLNYIAILLHGLNIEILDWNRNRGGCAVIRLKQVQLRLRVNCTRRFCAGL
jgi:hypothetical protein